MADGLLDRIGRTLRTAGSGIGDILAAGGQAYAPPDMDLTRNQQMGLLGSRLGDMMVGPRGEMTNNTPAYLDNIRRENELARRRGVMDSPQIQGLLSNVNNPTLGALLQEQVASGDVSGALTGLFNYEREEEAKQAMITAARLSGLDPATLAALEGMDSASIAEFMESERTRMTQDQERRFNQGSAIRDDFMAETEGFRERQDKYQQIRNFSENPSAAGDIAMVFAYMKLLDPNSVVREGEYATAAEAGSIIDRATRGTYNRLVAGERLTPSQRADFANAAKSLYQDALEGYFNTRESAVAKASNFGLDFDRDVEQGDLQAISLRDLQQIPNYTASDFEIPDLSPEEAQAQAADMVRRNVGLAIKVQEALEQGDDLGLIDLGYSPVEAKDFIDTFTKNAEIAFPDMDLSNFEVITR